MVQVRALLITTGGGVRVGQAREGQALKVDAALPEEHVESVDSPSTLDAWVGMLACTTDAQYSMQCVTFQEI